jgi:hypothetical protein
MLPRLTHLLRLGLALAAPLALVACSGETANDAPIIDSVEAPVVAKATDGSYAITVGVLFHDNDGEAITRVHYRLLPDIEGVVDVPEANPTRQSALVTLVIPASALDGNTALSTRADDRGNDGHGGAPSGGHRDDARHQPRTLQVMILDGRGAESLPTSSTVTLN